MRDHDDDAGEAFDRAAARAAKGAELFGSPGVYSWHRGRRYRGSVTRLALVVFLLPAHIVAAGRVTGWLVAHLVLVAILASRVVSIRMRSNERIAAGPPWGPVV